MILREGSSERRPRRSRPPWVIDTLMFSGQPASFKTRAKPESKGNLAGDMSRK
jgi:hypothetical protein